MEQDRKFFDSNTNEQECPCSCCGCLVGCTVRYGSDIICPVCNWQDDKIQNDTIYYHGGANGISLYESRKNYHIHRAKIKDVIAEVSLPTPEMLPESKDVGAYVRRITKKGRGYPCLCCGCFTLPSKDRNSFETCPVCGWEDDPLQNSDSECTIGENDGLSLKEAKKNFLLFGAKDRKTKEMCREALFDEKPDSKQVVDPSYPCPCCGGLTFDKAEYGSHDVCPVCLWEEDLYQKNNPESEQGTNRVSLRKAQANFELYRASEKELIKFSRLPRDYEVPFGKLLEYYQRKNPAKGKMACLCCGFLTLSRQDLQGIYPSTKQSKVIGVDSAVPTGSYKSSIFSRKHLTKTSWEEVIPDTCPVCLWQNVTTQNDRPDIYNNANFVSLEQARKNFVKYGAKTKYVIAGCRKPYPEEIS